MPTMLSAALVWLPHDWRQENGLAAQVAHAYGRRYPACLGPVLLCRVWLQALVEIADFTSHEAGQSITTKADISCA